MAPVVDVELRDGMTVRVRPVLSDDVEALEAFVEGLSPEARRQRFFGTVDPAGVAKDMAAADGSDHHGLVALTGVPERIVGHAHYVRDPTRPVAEAAFAVADRMQGQGLGTLLLAHLAERAHAEGIATFEAVTMRGNRRMVDMFRASGFPVEVQTVDGERLVRFPTSLSPAAVAAFEARERVAVAAMVRRLLAPASVVVVGASRSRGTVGGEVLHHLREGGYTGRLYAVNHSAAEVQGMPAYATVDDLPDPVDLAVIAVPGAAVLEVVRACARRGVRSLVVLSAGFAEVGAAGAARQRELVDICRATGMRLVGPNCLGALNTAPATRLNATFAMDMPPAGGVGMLSQSGGLGIALLEGARDLGIGISSFVSVGNKADVSGNDLLRYWEQDEATNVAVLYLESFGNPRRFAEVARRICRVKPVVAMKGGRGAAGARAAGSHTGALVAASDVTVDALFRQAGVIRTHTITELFDVTKLLASQPVPAGTRVGIITNVGGPAILCADACEEEGLQVPELEPAIQDRLREFAAAEASVGNPVDLLAAATPEDFGRAVRVLGDHAGLDALIAIYIQPGLGSVGGEVAAAVSAAARALESPLTVATVLMSADDREAVSALGDAADAPPVFAYPEGAALAVAQAARYGVWRRRPAGHVPAFPDARPERAAALLAAATVGEGRWLSSGDVADLFGCYGLPLIETRTVRGPADAGRAAQDLGVPVALKAVAPGLVHKSDVGAVALDLEGPDAVAEAALDMRRHLAGLGHEVSGFLVQPMATGGVEMLVGATTDPQFGPVVVCGAGGTDTEIQRDMAVRLTPLSDLDAAAMVRELRLLPLLHGYRGAPACDIAAVEDVVLRLAAMVHAHPQLVEVDCNPVSVSPEGAVILDARVRVAPAPAPAPWPSLHAPPPVG